MKKIVGFYRRIRDFLIRTLSVYTLYFGLKVFYVVDVGLEWILFIIMVGIAQTITEKSAIDREIKKLLKRFKNSEVLHIGDQFIYPMEVDGTIKKVMLEVVDKNCTHIYAETCDVKTKTIKIRNEDLDAKVNMKIYLNS